jgi:hypothetical protein
MNPDYIEILPDYKVDLSKLLEEYNMVKHLLSDRKRPNSPVLIQRALNLATGHRPTDTLDSLPYTVNVVKHLMATYSFNTVSYRCIMPDTCYSWHTDFSEVCLHIPLITNEGCRFVYEDKAFHMPADGSVYIVNNEKSHSFMNGGTEPRVHITLENFGSRPMR